MRTTNTNRGMALLREEGNETKIVLPERKLHTSTAGS